MGVIYKLKVEVVDFIINQRHSNPLASCRQLAEATSQKFGLHLSKSSVHDVLKESGITTPRGRKPKAKFEIPQDKRKQIQDNLSLVKLLPDPVEKVSELVEQKAAEPAVQKAPEPPIEQITAPAVETKVPLPQNDTETAPEYDGGGKIFLKAALWDLGIFSEDNIKETDWDYYLTYSKGVKVILENNGNFFIDLILPIERCVKEVADGLINNVKPLVVHKVSDEELFKSCMEAQAGFKISGISIVDYKDHVLLDFVDIMELKRYFSFNNRIFVESHERNLMTRSKSIFFSQITDNNGVVDNIANLKAFDTVNEHESIVTLLIDDSYENKAVLQEAADKLNNMYLRDEQGRLVKVKIFIRQG